MTRPTLCPVSYDQFVADITALRALIDDEAWQPNFIVGIGRGGLVPAVYLSHATGISLLSVDHSSKVPTFGENLLEILADKTKAGVRLLIVDDINDSGNTLQYLRRKFEEFGGIPMLLRVAVLIDNSQSIERVDYRARTIDRRIESSWFVFPWEAMERSEDALVEAAILHHAPN